MVVLPYANYEYTPSVSLDATERSRNVPIGQLKNHSIRLDNGLASIRQRPLSEHTMAYFPNAIMYHSATMIHIRCQTTVWK